MVVVIVNNSDDERRVHVPVWEIGLMREYDMEQVFVTYENGYDNSKLGYSVREGWLDVGMRNKSAMVLRKMQF